MLGRICSKLSQDLSSVRVSNLEDCLNSNSSKIRSIAHHLQNFIQSPQKKKRENWVQLWNLLSQSTETDLMAATT